MPFRLQPSRRLPHAYTKQNPPNPTQQKTRKGRAGRKGSTMKKGRLKQEEQHKRIKLLAGFIFNFRYATLKQMYTRFFQR